MKKLNSRGFSHIEAFIVVVVVALIGAIGFYVWQRSSNNNPDSLADTKVLPIPVYRLNYNYPGTSTIRDYDYAVGTKALKTAIKNNGKDNVTNMGVVFMAFPKSSGAGNELYKLRLSGGGERTDNNTGKTGAKSVLFTTDKYVKDKLVNKLRYESTPTNARLLDIDFAYNGVVPIRRLWKTVTKDERRLYRYSTNSEEVKQLQNKYKYNLDKGSEYGPSIQKYCHLRKTKKYGQICTPKYYKLPNLDAFNGYIQKSLLNDYLRQVQYNDYLRSIQRNRGDSPNSSSPGGSSSNGGNNTSNTAPPHTPTNWADHNTPRRTPTGWNNRTLPTRVCISYIHYAGGSRHCTTWTYSY